MIFWSQRFLLNTSYHETKLINIEKVQKWILARKQILSSKIETKNSLLNLGKPSKKKVIFHTLVGWVGLKKLFSIKNKNKKHGLKMPKIA